MAQDSGIVFGEEMGPLDKEAMPTANMTKRLDIQALRALAVVAVLLFHTGLFLQWGFLGVDVFFVVSGFVVTQLMLRRIGADGRLDLLQFWKQRIRRLFPGLALMLIVASPISLLVFPRFVEASPGLTTAAAGIFSFANVSAALLEFDYFAAPSKENFMLHLWSLSIEEQFYIVWPILFFLLFSSVAIQKFRRIVVAAIVVSLGAWAVGSTELLGLLDRGQAFVGFFSPLARAWELMVGALLTIIPPVRGQAKNSRRLSLTGWAMVLGVLIVGPETGLGPNVGTLLLVLGVCMILRWGSQSGNSPTLRQRKYRWITFIGDRSYSLYLWHWPFSVYAAVLFPASEFSSLVGILVSIPLALVAFSLVENPFRTRRGIGKKKLRVTVPLFTALTSVVLAATAASFSTVERVLAPSSLAGGLNEDEYYSKAAQISVDCQFNFECFQSLDSPTVDILILGNSHGAHLTVGLAEAFPKKNVVWVANSSIFGADSDVSRIFEQIESSPVVIVSEYLSKPGMEKANRDWETTFQRLAAIETKVLVTNGSPTLETPAYKCKYGVIWNPSQKRCFFPAQANNARHTIFSTDLQAAAAPFDDVEVVDLYGLFCNDKTCQIGDEEAIYFRDRNHFTAYGSAMAAEVLGPAIQRTDGQN